MRLFSQFWTFALSLTVLMLLLPTEWRLGTDRLRFDHAAHALTANNTAAVNPYSLQEWLTAYFAQGFIPPGDGAPEETTTAGSRRERRCGGDRLPMRSLMPTQNYGLTFAEHPTLFLEMPQTNATKVLLLVQNEAGDYTEEAVLPIPEADEQGVVAFQLPDDAAPLTIGQNYRWALAVMCEGYLDPSDPFFEGWVQRVERSTDIDQTLANLSLPEQIEWLGDRGYWYDMVPLLLHH